MFRNLVFFFGILGAMLFIVASILGGLQIEGYSFVSQFISESYAQGLPNTSYLRYMYIASGILLALFGFMAPAVMTKISIAKIWFWLFALFYGFGTVVTGFFPCDMDCNPDPEKASLSQFIHNTAGFLTYTIVPFCLIGIGVSLRNKVVSKSYLRVSILCGFLALSFVVLLFGSFTGSYIGLFQRIIEASILFWVL